MDIAKTPHLRQIQCASAAALIATLAPSSEWFERSEPEDWIFRGQADSAWGLSPSAFREHALLQHPLVSDPFSEWYNSHQFEAEFDALRRFALASDASGLRLPEDSTRLRQILDELNHWCLANPHEPIPWPPEELWSLLALAQHHGVPTRFLDWTRDSYTAAYFAAGDTQTSYLSSDIAVWAYSAKAEAAGRLAQRMSSYAHPVRLVTAPYAENPNLRAQRGVHIILAGATLDPHLAAERVDLSSHIADVQFLSDGPALLKFLLPRTESPALLRLLAKYGVSAASLFPGYSGVVKGMLEEERWRERKRTESHGWQLKREKRAGRAPRSR